METQNLAKWISELQAQIDQVKRMAIAAAASGGDTVTITPALDSGTKIADYTIGEETSGSLYAPTPTSIPNIFSGDEVLVGNNGVSDVYCKRVHLDALPSTTNAAQTIPHSVANISAILKWDAYAISSTGTVQKINALAIGESGNFVGTGFIGMYVNDTNFYITVGSDRSALSADVYIYYTKTPPVETKKSRKK